MMTDSKIAVMIRHRVPIVSAGLEAALRAQPGFEIIPPGEPQFPTSDGTFPNSVILIADGDTGVRVARSVRRGGCVLIVTEDESEASVRFALEAGVRGYLLLSSPLDVMRKAVQCVHDGGTVIDPIVATRMVDSFAGRALTGRELDVLALLMLGLGDKAIASRLDICLGTVKTHMKSLRAKLDAATRTEAVVIAQRRGLVRALTKS